MTDTDQSTMDKIAREWLMSREVIADFLREFAPSPSQEVLDTNAAALLARLASHDPPLLLRTLQDEQRAEAAIEACRLALPVVAAMCNALGETCSEDDAKALFALQDVVKGG